MHQVAIFTSLVGVVAGAAWDYKQQGSDWEASCTVGKFMQSPIDVTSGDVPIDGGNLRLHGEYSNKCQNGYKVEDNGHAIQVNCKAGAIPAGTLTADGTTHNVLQYHFHAPSEHRVGGVQHPLEAHFVHSTDDSQLSVLGVFFSDTVDGGKPSPFLENLYSLIKDLGDFSAFDEPNTTPLFELPTLFSQIGDVYRYDGSLTTPPCTEGVKWFVAAVPLSASSEQITYFQNYFAYPDTLGNWRVTQNNLTPSANTGYVWKTTLNLL